MTVKENSIGPIKETSIFPERENRLNMNHIAR
jgi:hypothetical protein